MSLRPRRILTSRRLPVAAAAIALAVGVGACGHKESHPTYADNEGFYVAAGPLTYQVQISRPLNPFAVDDKEYLMGVSATPPNRNQMWFAVFLRGYNFGKHPATTTDSFDLIDTQGHVYYPVPINAAANPLAWTPQLLKPGGVEPNPDSLASFGPTQGKMLLFKVNDDVYSNRPLALQIHQAGQAKASRVSLDL
jgi:hypothetical protein